MIGDLFPGSAPVLLGILNVTPDSFSDGGQFASVEQAVAHGLDMAEAGAQVIDVGGESTRPGARPVDTEVQRARVLEVIGQLRLRLPPTVLISIDTTRADVAADALACGARIINDVSAGRDDPQMFALAALTGSPMVLMHMRGTPLTMHRDPRYADVVSETLAFLLERAEQAQRAGVAREAIVLDPGIGFGKRSHHNLRLLGALDRFVAAGYPVLLGASRKQFMGTLFEAMRPADLLAATCATTALGVMAGVRFFRVHDVRENRQAAEVAWAIKQAAGGK